MAWQTPSDALEVSDTTYSLALIREYLMSRGCSKTVQLLDAMKIKVRFFGFVCIRTPRLCTFHDLDILFAINRVLNKCLIFTVYQHLRQNYCRQPAQNHLSLHFFAW